MTDYRLYIFAETGHIRKRLDLNCDTDEEAEQVTLDHKGAQMELWDRYRLLKSFRND